MILTAKAFGRPSVSSVQCFDGPQGPAQSDKQFPLSTGSSPGQTFGLFYLYLFAFFVFFTYDTEILSILSVVFYVGIS